MTTGRVISRDDNFGSAWWTSPFHTELGSSWACKTREKSRRLDFAKNGKTIIFLE